MNFILYFSLVLIKLRNDCLNYLTKIQIDSSIKLYHSARNENLSTFIKSLKMKRSHDTRDTQKYWSSADCNYDSNVEFYCNGRLPVFNEWTTENAKLVRRKEGNQNHSLLFFF
jgi:hypothetical protein